MFSPIFRMIPPRMRMSPLGRVPRVTVRTVAFFIRRFWAPAARGHRIRASAADQTVILFFIAILHRPLSPEVVRL